MFDQGMEAAEGMGSPEVKQESQPSSPEISREEMLDELKRDCLKKIDDAWGIEGNHYHDLKESGLARTGPSDWADALEVAVASYIQFKGQRRGEGLEIAQDLHDRITERIDALEAYIDDVENYIRTKPENNNPSFVCEESRADIADLRAGLGERL